MAESLNENVEKLQEESNNKQHQLNFLIQQVLILFKIFIRLITVYIYYR